MVDVQSVVEVVGSVVQGASLVVAGASTIAALTPTPKDDSVLKPVRRVLEVLAMMFGHAKVGRR